MTVGKPEPLLQFGEIRVLIADSKELWAFEWTNGCNSCKNRKAKKAVCFSCSFFLHVFEFMLIRCNELLSV